MKIGNLEVYGIIYLIRNKINNKMYIGQTIKEKGFNGRYCCKGIGMERVYKYHLKCKETNNNSFNKYLFNSIEKYGFDAFEVNEVFDIAFSQEELNIKEECWILYYDSFNNGYNFTVGGGGTKGHRALKGSDNPTSRKVVQLDLEGNYIKTWDYMTQACDILGVDKTGMIRSCNDKHYSSGGFLWVYFNEYDKNIKYEHISKRQYKKEVYKLNKNYEIVEKYESSKEASRINNINHVSISRCCTGMRKTYLGYIWMNKEDYDKKYINTSKVN